MPHVFPELVPTMTCEQSPDYHPEGSVFNHIRLMLSQLPCPLPDESLPWAALLHDIAKPRTASRGENGIIHFYTHEKLGAEMAEEILQRLKFPRKQTDAIAAAVRHHMQFKDAPHMRKSTLRRMLMRETFPLELELHRLDCLGSHRRLDIYDFLREQRAHLNDQPHLHPPLLTGEDLIALGMKPGPELGAMLAEIREKQLADELSSAEQARSWVQKNLGQPPG
jgi:poly(A) polymerase